jgi:LPXTG-motif cell wall-anchored protein
MSKLKFTLAGAATSIVAAALVLAGAGPASAYVDPRTLPVGDSMYAIDCDQTDNAQVVKLYSVNAFTAEPTLIGDGTQHFEQGSCSAQPAWNASNNTAYFIEWTTFEDPDNVSVAVLMTMDLATGESTQVNPFFEGDDTYVNVQAMAITPSGAAFAVYEGYLYSVDLTNAHLTPIGETVEDLFGFGSDPKSGVLWAIDRAADVYTINPANGDATFVATYDVDTTEPETLSLQVDSAGIVWVIANYFGDSGLQNELWSNTQAIGPDSALQGAFNNFIEPFYSQALLIVPAVPALAATGSSFDGSLALGGAALLLLAGATFVVVRRRATA